MKPGRRFLAWLEKHHIGIILFWAGLVILAGFVYSNTLGDTLRFLPDEAEYVNLARHLVEKGIYSKDGVNPTAYRPPGYPILLSVLHLLGGDVLQYRYLNFLLLGGCVLLTGRILSQQGLSLAGVFGSLLVTAYPALFYLAGTLYPQTLAAFLFLLVLKIYTQRQLHLYHHLIAGLLFGFLVLTVPTFFYTFFLIGLWLFFYRRSQLMKYALVGFTTMLLVIGAWSVRNYSAFGEIFFISTNSGENLLLGNSENTTPNGGTMVDISAYLDGAAGLNEVGRDRYFRSKALEYIASHPIDSARLYLQKTLNYFNYRNELVTLSEQSPDRDLLMLVTYGPLLAVFMLRMLLLVRIKASPAELLFILLYFSSAMVTAIFFTRIRFRLPFDYLLIMVVAILLERVISLKYSQSNRILEKSIKSVFM